MREGPYKQRVTNMGKQEHPYLQSDHVVNSSLSAQQPVHDPTRRKFNLAHFPTHRILPAWVQEAHGDEDWELPTAVSA
jgi:hypothetical protein